MLTPPEKSQTSFNQYLNFIILNITVQDYCSFVVIFAGLYYLTGNSCWKRKALSKLLHPVDITLKYLSISLSNTCPSAPFWLLMANSRRWLPAQLTFSRETDLSCACAKTWLSKKQEEGDVTKPKASCTALVCVLTGSNWEGSCSYCYVNRSLRKYIILGESFCGVWELR